MNAAACRPKPLSIGPAAAGALIALLCAGCTVGLDDRPVPPEAIPSVSAELSSASTVGAAGGDYASLAASAVVAEPPPAAEPAAAVGGEMVWRTGPEPAAIETADLPPPAEEENVQAADEQPVRAEAVAAAEETPAQPEAPLESAAAAEPESFRFAPVVGAEAGDAEPLAQALRAEASKRGVALDGGADAPVLKTYLSSFPENGGTTLVYVLDVYDGTGTRLTRIDGQEKAPGSVAGWSDVPPGILKAVAASAMARLKAWQGSRTG